jgi:hypothetical protein
MAKPLYSGFSQNKEALPLVIVGSADISASFKPKALMLAEPSFKSTYGAVRIPFYLSCGLFYLWPF